MDDRSQPNLRHRTTGDCSAAECIEPENSIQDTSPCDDLSTGEASTPGTLRPFVWQMGRRLLLLERERGHWVLAELEFEPTVCRYTEIRRAFYRWEREAVGVLLSRTIGYGQEAASESAELLNIWIRRRR